MGKEKTKENKKTDEKEQEEKKDQNETGEITIVEEEREEKKPGMPQSTKAIIAILVVIILVLIGFLLFSSGKKSENKSIDIISEEASQNANTSSGSSSSSLNTGNTASTIDNTNSLPSDTVPTETVVEKNADLYIVEYAFSEDPKMGEEFTVKIKIGNKGKIAAKNFHWEWWPTAYDKACEGEVDSLAVGEVKKVECNYTYGGWSTYATKAIVDSKYDVDESDEGNNIVTKEVVPTHDLKVDLYISDYTFNHPPKQGEAFTVSITIKNKGDGDAGSFWWEWWPTAYGKACREKIDGLDAHDDKTVTCTYTYGGWANYVTKAVADADNDVSESDEGNNTYTQNVIPIH